MRTLPLDPSLSPSLSRAPAKSPIPPQPHTTPEVNRTPYYMLLSSRARGSAAPTLLWRTHVPDFFAASQLVLRVTENRNSGPSAEQTRCTLFEHLGLFCAMVQQRQDQRHAAMEPQSHTHVYQARAVCSIPIRQIQTPHSLTELELPNLAPAEPTRSLRREDLFSSPPLATRLASHANKPAKHHQRARFQQDSLAERELQSGARSRAMARSSGYDDLFRVVVPGHEDAAQYSAAPIQRAPQQPPKQRGEGSTRGASRAACCLFPLSLLLLLLLLRH